MTDFKVCGFQKNYKMLDSAFEKENKELYDLGVLVAHISELKDGFIVKKKLKTTTTGTKFNYKVCESQEEADAYRIKLKEMYNKLDSNLITMKLKDAITQINEISEDSPSSTSFSS